MMSMRKSLFWSLSQQGGMMVLQILNMVVIARLLTPDEIGVFIVALSIAMIVQALREMGVTNYLIRAPELKDTDIRASFGMSAVLCGFFGITLLLLRHQLEGWIGTPGLAQVLVPVAVVMMIFPIEQPAQAIIRRQMRFETLHHISLISKLISVFTGISLALMGYSTMALAIGMLTEAVLRVVLLSWFEPRHLKLGPSLRGWRPLLNFGIWASGASIMWQVAIEGIKIVIGATLGAAPTALYDRAQRIPNMVRMNLFMPLGRVMLSSFSEDLRMGRPIGDKVEKLTAFTSCLIWPVFAVLAVLSEEVVLLMLGPQWDAITAILPWLLLSQGFKAFLPQPDHLLLPFSEVRRLFVVRLLQTLITFAAAAATLPFGLLVFAMFTPVSTLAMMVVIWVGIAPFAGVSLGRLTYVHLKSALVALVTVAPIAAWKYAGLGGGSYAILLLLLVLSAGMGLATAVFSAHPVAHEIKRGWMRIAGRRAAP